MTRVLTAAILAPIVVWAVLFSPAWVFLLICALIGGIAVWEFDAIAAAHGFPRHRWRVIVLGVIWLAVPERMASVAIVLIAMTLAGLLLRERDLTAALRGSAAGLLGIVYIFGAFRCAIGLRALNPHWLMIALLVCWIGDTCAYYAGRAFGRRRMAPVISPGKTWEGAIASVIGAMIAAALYAHFLIEPAPLWAVLLTAAFANGAGQVGDLAESAFKRGANVKDSGTTLPGHGGWLDRIDSSLFSIPAVYAIFRILLDFNP
jgi:phosphatidate cytidylyltransferase